MQIVKFCEFFLNIFLIVDLLLFLHIIEVGEVIIIWRQFCASLFYLCIFSHCIINT
jgi:hypothetical protein